MATVHGLDYLGVRWRIIGQWVDVGGGVGPGRVYVGSTSRVFIPAVQHAAAIGTHFRGMNRSVGGQERRAAYEEVFFRRAVTGLHVMTSSAPGG